MTKPADIAIIGGGLNGMVMAAAATAVGLRVNLFESRTRAALSNPKFDGRAYALSYSSVMILRALGLWDALLDKAQPILDIKIADAHTGADDFAADLLHFDHHELEEGPMGYMIEDRHFRATMLDWADSCDHLCVHFDQRVKAETALPDCLRISGDFANHYDAKLVIAADGHKSPTARRNGLHKHGWRYAQTSLVCAIEHELPP